MLMNLVLSVFQILALLQLGIVVVEVALLLSWSKYSGIWPLVSSVFIGYVSLVSIVFLKDKSLWVRKILVAIWNKCFTSFAAVAPLLVILTIFCFFATKSVWKELENQFSRMNIFVHILDAPKAGAKASLRNLRQNNVSSKDLDKDGTAQFRAEVDDIILLKLSTKSKTVTFRQQKVSKTPHNMVYQLKEGIANETVKPSQTAKPKAKSPQGAFELTQLARLPVQIVRGQNKIRSASKVTRDTEYVLQGIPSDSNLHRRKGFLFSYNPTLKIPNWVAYIIKSEPTKKGYRRPKIDFLFDPYMQKEIQATAEDFKGAFFDRGNLVYWRDIASKGPQAVKEAFYMSVIAPQTTPLNRGLWRRIEAYGSAIASSEDLGVIAGPIFRPEKPGHTIEFLTMGRSAVAVPTHFFRIHYRPGGMNVQAFIVPNTVEREVDIKNFLVSVRQIEKETGLDFFNKLPQNQQNKIETIKPTELWQ